jgi:phenylacetate-CoA ligase
VREYYSKVAGERLATDQADRLDRLKKTIALARAAPFYKDKLAGVTVRSLDDLASLPMTHKEDLKSNPAEAFLACPKEKVWHFHESFGTTGRPVAGWYTLDDIEVEIDTIQRWLTDFGPGKTIVNRYPYAFPVPAQLVETAARLMGGTVIPTSNLTYNVGYKRVLRLMQEREANILTAMPLEAILLKETALALGMDPAEDFPSMESFCFAGRILTPSWRRSMMEDWGCEVRNLYGCTEGGPFATSDDRGDLRLHDDFFLFEILDPETEQPVSRPGEEGVLVATTLCREAQPMIRYWTGDLVRLLDCPDDGLGRGIEVLGRAGGRRCWGGAQVTDFDLEEEILSWSTEFHANVFFVCITRRGFLVRVEAGDPRAVDVRAGERRLTDRLGVPVRVEVLPRGHLISHVSLLSSAAVFKPRAVCDFRTEERKIINLSGGLIDWWAEVTPALMWMGTVKWVRDLLASLRIRLLG